ncbi:type 1 glutamine amidotransferase [Bacillus alkalicellulosilyticus]|uniref:type 1 glutamine amidotransferase n=1 Tax=Alkalihalobacterium alkalicellulosilyticum TaxID=1912214 RepID=UPI0014836607|nr:gamma-glutamyl-gamma-aminobutyrate hydrolase family protein [Bacillus alkalicellulosilyticus]
MIDILKNAVGVKERLDLDIKYRDELTQISHNIYSGIIILGSFTPYNDESKWVQDLKHFIIEVYKLGQVPLLGICMAHELIASIFGGKVQKHKFRRELGTVQFELTEDGCNSMLFDGITKFFNVNTAHSHDVIEPPLNANILAFNERGPCQSFKLKNLYCVQFHPDIKTSTLKKWLKEDSNIERLINEKYINSKDEIDKFLDDTFYITETNIIIFRNFLRICKHNT